jgi:hypothetical protein
MAFTKSFYLIFPKNICFDLVEFSLTKMFNTLAPYHRNELYQSTLVHPYSLIAFQSYQEHGVGWEGGGKGVGLWFGKS